jgi:hypothetical protein
MFRNVLRDAEVVDFAHDAVAPFDAYLDEAAEILTVGRQVRGRRRPLLSEDGNSSGERCGMPSPSQPGTHSRPTASGDPTRRS